MNVKWKLQFSDAEVGVLKVVLAHIISQNHKVIGGNRTKELYAIDKMAHTVCRDDCQRILDYIISTTE
jgi:hypothetical protein